MGFGVPIGLRGGPRCGCGVFRVPIGCGGVLYGIWGPYRNVGVPYRIWGPYRNVGVPYRIWDPYRNVGVPDGIWGSYRNVGVPDAGVGF